MSICGRSPTHKKSFSASALEKAVTQNRKLSGDPPASNGHLAMDYAPPAPSLNTSTLEAANNSVFLELPVGWYGDWHTTPVKQWLILMSGEGEFEAGDGERVICKAGDVVLLDDITGQGHRTIVLADVPDDIARSRFNQSLHRSVEMVMKNSEGQSPRVSAVLILHIKLTLDFSYS